MPLAVTPDPLEKGGEATISYGPDPARANTTITVEIESGGDAADSVDIPLDAAGEGTETWTVPDWNEASFRAAECPAVYRSIVNPPEG